MDSRVREQLVQSFLNSLHEDKIPWHKCWTTTRPINFKNGIPYKGINTLMLSFVAEDRGYTDPRWLTFLQAKEQGAFVRQGEQSTRVEYWQYYDKVLRKSLDRSEVAEIQKNDPQRMKDIRLAAYVYSVFNAEQVTGLPTWIGDTPIVQADLLKAQRTALLSNLGVGFRLGVNKAYYAPQSDEIVMPPEGRFHSDYAYVCTLLHEAGHATGHSSRLNRPLDGRFGSTEYAKEELRAEIASAFAAQALGIPMRAAELTEHIDQHKAYIQSWIEVLENDPNELFAAVKDADKISDYLLAHGNLRELATEQPAPTHIFQEAEQECDVDFEP